jgi:hypothetical protein
MLRSALQQLQLDGLVHQVAQGGWSLTAVGEDVRVRGHYLALSTERTSFYFRHPSTSSRLPVFLPLKTKGEVFRPAGNWTFDVAHLKACLLQPVEWKLRVGFPVEVSEVLLTETEPHAADSTSKSIVDWQRVAIDYPESIQLAFIQLKGAQPGKCVWQAHAVRMPEGRLLMQPVALAAGTCLSELIPELNSEPTLTAWQAAFRSWCVTGGLSNAQVLACRLERREHNLRIYAPAALIERLRKNYTSRFRDEIWILAGSGEFRTAACLDIRPTLS